MFVARGANARAHTPLYNVCTTYVQRMYNVVYNVEHYIEQKYKQKQETTLNSQFDHASN